MFKQFTLSFLSILTKIFRLPEFVVCKVVNSTVYYLTEISSYDAESYWQWSMYVDDALLFKDLDHVKRKFPAFDQEKYLIISYLDDWTNQDILRELNYEF